MQKVAVLHHRNTALQASQARYQQVEQAMLASEARYRRLAAEQAWLAKISRIISASLDIPEVYEPLAVL